MLIRRAMQGDEAAIAKVYVNSWKTTYQNIIPETYLNGLEAGLYSNIWSFILNEEKTIVYVAENAEGEIVGFASGGNEQTEDPHYTGEVYAIYILQNYQRKGIGKSLIKRLLKELRSQGYVNLIIWALKDNHNRSFYESFGGTIKKTKPFLVSGASLTEVGYVWENIDEVLNEL
ncbi:GNAT family N-acetyltransferase [Peribacillus sp. SCS-155]|uniref:GNAT family N-acetyltransferase n=1 Tax=Peribacillus sedimenti TaxID=3115297 RepID=UPI00390655C3